MTKDMGEQGKVEREARTKTSGRQLHVQSGKGRVGPGLGFVTQRTFTRSPQNGAAASQHLSHRKLDV